MGKPTDLVQGTLDMLILKTIFTEPKHGWAIENSPSLLIADYFQLSKFQLALTDGLLSFIDQPG